MPVPSRFGVYAAGSGGSPPTSTTTWNPADKDASITLSPGNLIATKSGGNFFKSGRAIASKSSGKYYTELTNTSGAGGGGTMIAWANSAAPLNNFMGGSGGGSVSYGDNGRVLMNGADIHGHVDDWSIAGDVARMAIDITNKLLWVGKVGTGLWNGSGTANPATGVGGISIAAIAAGPYFPAYTLFFDPSVSTVNFGATAYAGFLPAGFSNVT